MRHIIIITFIFFFIDSCTINKSNLNVKDLIGTWTLDSASYPNGKLYKNEDYSRTLIFKNKTDYSYEWWNDDVGNTYTGKYFILDNPKRGLKTLTFIPDIQIYGNDTIRIEYMNLDIVSLKRQKLIMVDETKWIDRDPLSRLPYNKIYIYKKIK